MERKRFIQVKKYGNNSEYLYLIDANWINNWIAFVRQGQTPGKINNDQLNLQLTKGQKLYIGLNLFALSEKLWSMFYQ